MHNGMNASQKHTMQVKEMTAANLKSLQVDSIFMTFLQKLNHCNRKQNTIYLGQQEDIGF